MFGKKRDDVPQTITDEQMRDIRRRAQWAHRDVDPLSKKEIERRLSSSNQQQQRHLS